MTNDAQPNSADRYTHARDALAAAKRGNAK